MSTLYLTQFGGVGVSGSDIAQEPAIGTQTVAIGVEAKSTTFDRNCSLVRIHVDAICSIHFSLPDTSGNYTAATTSSRRLAADQTEYFGVPRDSLMKLSVISNS